MVLIKYEDFTKAKVSSIERLAGSLGLTPINDIAQTVDVQYQPPGDHSEAVEDFFGAINLRLIESLCRDEMMALDYPQTSQPATRKSR
jgi:hypothetical protein